MGTQKRERQKANRQLKLQELNKQVEKQKKKRLALRIGLGIVGVFVLVYGLSLLSGKDDETTTTVDSVAAAVDTTTTAVSTETTSVETTVAETTTTAKPVEPLPTVTVEAPEALAAGNLPCPAADGSSGRIVSFPSVQPPTCIDRAKTYTAEVTTTQGSYTIELDAAKAPVTVNNFVYLARYHYFDNTLCHRIVPGFMAQCGDPTATGSGGPGYQFADELPAAGQYKLGSVAMANAGSGTNGSQFFVVTGDKGIELQPNYSLFGQVTDGLDTTVSDIDALGVGDGVPSKEPVFITSVTITEK